MSTRRQSLRAINFDLEACWCHLNASYLHLDAIARILCKLQYETRVVVGELWLNLVFGLSILRLSWLSVIIKHKNDEVQTKGIMCHRWQVHDTLLASRISVLVCSYRKNCSRLWLHTFHACHSRTALSVWHDTVTMITSIPRKISLIKYA